MVAAACGSTSPTSAHVPAPKGLPATWRDLGPAAAGQVLSLEVGLPDPTAARRAADVAAMYRPGSPQFGRFLSPVQFAARYGPSPDQVAAVRRVLSSLGLRSAWSPGLPWLTAAGPAALLDRVFGVELRRYRRADGTVITTSAGAPVTPPQLRGLVTSLTRPGSASAARLRTPAVRAGGLTPTDLLKAYDMSPLRQLGMDGRGQTVVFFEIDWYKQSEYDTFTTHFSLPPIKVVVRGTKRGTTSAGEMAMDLQVVHEIAPAANLVAYFWDFNDDPAQLMAKIVDENPGALVDIEVDGCEQGMDPALLANFESVYEKGASEGMTFFVPAGDMGAYDCAIRRPSGTAPQGADIGVSMWTSPPGVTSTGGTRISVRTDGSWYNETVWENPGQTMGGGGGLSSVYKRPTWQTGPGVDNPYSNGMRQVPDVASDSDPASGAAIFIGDSWTMGGGTSQSGPIWCGLGALTNQYLKSKGLHGIGFVNPALYKIAAGGQPYPPFHDVTVGTNLNYPATPAYDLATGLGTPDTWNLARDLEALQRSGQ